MKIKWPFFLGASVLLGAVSTTALHTTEKQQTKDLIARYVGTWTFAYPKEKSTHTLTIYPDLSITIDDKAVVYQLIELSEMKFAIQDQLGYHLLIQTENGLPATIYDEADDVTMPITLVTEIES